MEQWVQFAIIGFLGANAHLLIIRAFAKVPAPVLAPYMYVRLVWAIIFGYVAFGASISLQSIFGAALIILSGLYLHRVERGKRAA
jgi:drug/metabolite transporter (DMT)-like permease